MPSIFRTLKTPIPSFAITASLSVAETKTGPVYPVRKGGLDMGLTKEKFLEIESRVAVMTEEQLCDLELHIHALRMSRDPGLDDFLCKAQADEGLVHRPANRVNDYIPF